ncbi:hypothetical protein QUF50_03500 [Thiotrichales bacterium HSG1]|nr:hypothetical protein [Thiotrichales bacterium HSG1]
MSDDECERCGAKIEHYCDENCKECDKELPPPNIREVKRQCEVDELNRRYKDAINDNATTDDLKECLEDFEKAVQDDGKAIHNMNYYNFVTVTVNLRPTQTHYIDDNKDYNKEVFKENSRIVSDETHDTKCQDKKTDKAEFKTYYSDYHKKKDKDKQREKSDEIVFGKYKTQIRFASLSIDHKGLHNYGDICVHFKNELIENRATLLEENSKFFPNKHNIDIHENMPLGYRALWNSKGKLAIAKLAKEICTKYLENKICTEKDFQKLLLCCGEEKDTDKFIEIHIYGSFTMEQAKVVYGKPPVMELLDEKQKKEQETELKTIRETLERYNINWEQEVVCVKDKKKTL